MIDMEHADDDPGHPYAGTRTPHANAPSTRLDATPYGLERSLRAQNDAIRSLTGVTNAAPKPRATIEDPMTRADRISTAVWTLGAAGYAAVQTYLNVDLQMMSSTIMTYLGR